MTPGIPALVLLPMVQTPRTRATGDLATRGLGVTPAPATTRATDLLRGLQEPQGQEVTLDTGLLIVVVSLLQGVPRPPSTPCYKTGDRGSQPATREARLLGLEDPQAGRAEAILAGAIRLTRITEDR